MLKKGNGQRYLCWKMIYGRYRHLRRNERLSQPDMQDLRLYRLVPRRLSRYLFARITFRRWNKTLECDLGTGSQLGNTQKFEECLSKPRDQSVRDQLTTRNRIRQDACSATTGNRRESMWQAEHFQLKRAGDQQGWLKPLGKGYYQKALLI
jgi:hypothetical protein